MGSAAEDNSDLRRSNWVKQFNFIFWQITIDNGSYDEFIKARYAFAGYSETQTYSKTLWIIISVVAIILLLVGSIMFIVIGMESAFGEAEAFGIIILLVAIGYSYLFYRWTYVPPRA